MARWSKPSHPGWIDHLNHDQIGLFETGECLKIVILVGERSFTMKFWGRHGYRIFRQAQTMVKGFVFNPCFFVFLRLPFSFFFGPANFWTWRLGMFGTTGPAMWGFEAWGRGTLWVESLGDARYIQWLSIYTVIASPYNIKYPTKSRWNDVKCIGSILFFGPII